jgi:hypothetical protein
MYCIIIPNSITPIIDNIIIIIIVEGSIFCALGAAVLGALVLGALVLGALVLGALVLGALVLGALVLGALVLGALVLGALVLGALVGAAVSLKFSTFAGFAGFAVYKENCDPASFICFTVVVKPQKLGSQLTSESWGFPEESKFLVLFQHTAVSFDSPGTSEGTHILSGGVGTTLCIGLLISLRGLHIFVTLSFMQSGPQ